MPFNMHNEPVSTFPRPPRRARFQFSMLTVLIVVTTIAAGAVLLPRFGQQLFASIALTMVLVAPPICLGAFALYCRGRRQTFSLGAFAAALGTLVVSDVAGRGELGAVFPIALQQVIGCGVCGYLAVATRRFVERSGWDRPEGDDLS